MKKTVQSQPIKVNVDTSFTDLYEKAPDIFPRKIKGVFNTLRGLSAWALLGLYYAVPWFNYDGHQAILFDLPARKFYLLGLTIWPQDFILLSWLLIIAAMVLFFATSLAGRLWCGYACPQTVWTESFIWVERFFEGDRNKQMKLAKSPWNRNKIIRKTGKHFFWIILALLTGYTFVGYFTPIRELTPAIMAWSLGPWETFWILFYSFATWGNAGFLREQVCLYMCPYARFQGAMFDKDTLIVSYDKERGETRGSRKKGADYKAAGLGDCIDCELCVQVCPTGIDIRDGLQYECIACALCIDACDSIMDKMDYPRGLVGYTTEHREQGKETHIIRPRTIMYSIVLTIMISAFSYTVFNRVPLEIDVIRDRNSLYQENMMGMIENIYTLKILNMDNYPHQYQISASGIEGIKLIGKTLINVESGIVESVPIRLEIDPVFLKKVSSNVHFEIIAVDDDTLKASSESRFIGPRTR
jgi:cytochrome c oxidase accessory protein FixG